MATVGIDYSLPRPGDLDRWPSNPPSLSHTTTTDNSDERTGGGSPNLSTPMTPPLSLKELAQAERAYHQLDAPDAGAAAFNDKRSKRMSISRSMQSLRSMAKTQAEKARKRASTISERRPPPRSQPPPMPPVPSIPMEFKTAPAAGFTPPKPETKGFKAFFGKLKGKKTKAEAPPLPTPPSSASSSPPPFRDESSGELPKTKAEIKADEKAEKRRSKLAVKAAKRQSQSAAQAYATTYMTTSQRAAMALDKSLEASDLKVEKVNAPASVRGVLLDMQRSSAIIERRAIIRRQSLQFETTTANKHASVVSSKTGHSVAAPMATQRRSRRVPVPSFEPDESEPFPMPGDLPAPMDLEVSPEAAAAARAAALARLEGKPSQRTPVSEDEHAHILVSNLSQSNDGHVLRAKPSLQSISEKAEGKAEGGTAPLRLKRSLRKIDTVDVLHVNPAVIPLPRSPILDRTEPATQVPDLSDIVRPKHTGAVSAAPHAAVTRGLWTTEPDEMEGAEPLLPGSASQHSYNSFPRSATAPTLRRTKPSLRNLHKQPFDRSADASSDETHDVVRPLEISIAPRSATFGPCSNLNEPATPSSFEHAASENGHASSVERGSAFDHRGAAVRRYGSLMIRGPGGGLERSGSTATHAVPSLLGHGSSLGHGTSMTHNSFLDSAPPSPMGPRTPPDSHDGDHDATTPTTPKWRKSAQSLSRRLSTKTSATSLSRKLSIKPKEPPTSYDAYEAKQRELATRRRSCNPTVHDNASLQAEISEVRDKEEVRVAETFFLS